MKPEPNIFSSLFLFTTPTWYHNLKAVASVFSDFEKLPGEIQEQLNLKVDYSNSQLTKADAAFQLIKRGWVDVNPSNEFQPENCSISAKDFYTFARRFNKRHWIWYSLFRRLLTLRNPINEIHAFITTRKIQILDFYSSPLNQPTTIDLEKVELDKLTGVSVIIPTLNRYSYLKDVLEDLEKQTYTNFEVIVVDQSEPFNSGFYNQFNLRIKLIRQNEMKLWKALNTAIHESKYDLLLFFDDDSRVSTDWIFQHLKVLHFFNADISAGISLKEGQTIPEHYSYFRFSDQFDSGNSLVKKSVFDLAGLFDEQFEKMRMGDGEFGLRAALNGLQSISNPLASRVHLKVGKGGLREMGSWDAFRSHKWFAPKPVPSVVYFFRRYFPIQNVREAIILGVVLSLAPYKHKSSKVLTISSVILSLLFFPVIGIQVYKSWSIAKQMLLEGPKIKKHQN